MVTTPPYQTSTNLNYTGVVHGFFGSEGGVSTGIFKSLNCSLQKGDDESNVMQNRRLICQTMDIEHMVTLRQVHKADVLIVNANTKNGNEMDAMVSNTCGILLAIQTADCAPVLLVDPVACVIGAIHAGWRSAVQGIAPNTITAMQSLGAKSQNITAAIGPCIQQPSFEVGEDVFEAANDATFFAPSSRHCAQHPYFNFDLPGYLMHQLKISGIKSTISLQLNTYALNNQYFSYRRACHAQESSCGGQLSVIGLAL